MKTKFYRPILYYAAIAAQKFFCLLPYAWGFSFGGTIGKIIYHVLPKERKKTLSHLRLAFGSEKSEEEIHAIAKKVFEHYGQTIAEIALIDKIIPRIDEFVSAEGYEHFDKGLASGKGIIVAIAHFGNWEIMGGYTAIKGYPCTVIARKIYYEKYNHFLVSTRKKMKMEVIYRDQSPRLMLDTLHKNRLLGFVVDQDVQSVDGVFVDFFGRPAYTPIAPVRFSMKTGAPIVPVFCIREGMKHRMIVEPAIELTFTGDKEADLVSNTQKWVAVQENS